MKRACRWLLLLALCAPALQAQDAATEERLNALNGRIEDLVAGQQALRKQLADLAREVATLRDEIAKPNASYASQESLSRLAESVREVDRKRLEDYDKIRAELLKLGKTLRDSPAPVSPKRTASEQPDKPATPEKGFEHVVQKDQTLSMIVQAYREKGINVTVNAVLKANPNLKPEKMRVGQTIFIPAPQQ